jgi:hypothetical protein
MRKKPYFNSEDIPIYYLLRGSNEVHRCVGCGQPHRPISIISCFETILRQLCSPEGWEWSKDEPRCLQQTCECQNHFMCAHSFKHVIANHAWINVHPESKNDSRTFWKPKKEVS